MMRHQHHHVHQRSVKVNKQSKQSQYDIENSLKQVKYGCYCKAARIKNKLTRASYTPHKMPHEKASLLKHLDVPQGHRHKYTHPPCTVSVLSQNSFLNGIQKQTLMSQLKATSSQNFQYLNPRTKRAQRNK